MDEMRRRARVAAEQRRLMSHASSAQKLGGAPAPRGTDMRSVIAGAAERRNKITQGCASGSREVEKAAEEQSRRNGFRTKAEEDDANETAIMNALVELMEEEETRKLNEMYGTPSAEGGLIWTPENGLQFGESSTAPVSAPPTLPSTPQPPPVVQLPAIPQNTRPQPSTNGSARPISRLVAEDNTRKQQKLQRSATSLTERSLPQRPTIQPSRSLDSHPSSHMPSMWKCEICTLENPMTYLCCDACGVERPAEVSLAATEAMSAQAQPDSWTQQLAPGWTCGRCGKFMEHQWWTCSLCGTMKTSS
jgi:DNA-dependent metalloprotease WSS1